MPFNKVRILCDFSECPMKDHCRNFVEGFSKNKTAHWGKYPFPHKNKNGDCIGFDQLTADDIADKIIETIKPI